MAKIKSKGKTPLEQKEIDQKLLFMLEEAIPVDQAERRKYMGDIAIFYGSVFKSKLKHFIGLQLEELAQIGRTELGTNIIRSNISCFRLIDTWMDERTKEHLGNLNDVRNSFKEDENLLNNIKAKYEI